MPRTPIARRVEAWGYTKKACLEQALELLIFRSPRRRMKVCVAARFQPVALFVIQSKQDWGKRSLIEKALPTTFSVQAIAKKNCQG